MKIEDYKFGYMVFDGKKYQHDLILLPNGIIQKWWRKEGHYLILSDIGDIPLSQIECLIIGTGKFGMMKINEEVISEMKDRKIECTMEKTDKAVEMYNNIIFMKIIAAAFHLTC